MGRFDVNQLDRGQVDFNRLDRDPDTRGHRQDRQVVLGASLPLAPSRPQGDQALVIRVKNVPELVAKEGGATGKLVHSLVPQTIANTVYDKMAAEMRAKFKEKGVDADVEVTYAPPAVGRSPKDFFVGAGVGAGLIGAVWLIKGLLSRRR